MSQINTAVALILGVLTLAGIFRGFYVKMIKPAREQKEADRIAQRDAILGTPAIPDTTRPGHILHPASPGLPDRVETIEQALVLLAQDRHDLDELGKAHTDLVGRVSGHDEAIKELRAATAERVATKFESASAWNAVEAIANAQPPEEPHP